MLIRSSPALSRASRQALSARFAMPAPPSTAGSRAASGPARRALSSSKPLSSAPLYASQSSLPHLPVPALESTMSKYLETLSPLQTAEEHQASKKKMDDFLASPLSKTLQSRLEERAARKDSWLSEWWNEVAYMGYRGRIVPDVNYFYLHKEGMAKGKKQEERAAELVRAVVEFKKLVDSELLEPEKTKSGPLCSASYKYMFNAVRVPSSPADVPLAYPKELSHIVVLRKNRLFRVEVGGRGASEISQAMREIKQKVDAEPREGEGVGVLTVDDRDVWTQARKQILSLSKGNVKAIQDVESAMLLVCLDDGPAPKNGTERAWSYWAGGLDRTPHQKGWNRWFDKHQIIVDEAGESGFNGEHSMLDGTPTVRMNEFMLASIEAGKIPLELPEREKALGSASKPTEIVFELDAGLRATIKKSQEGFGQEMSLQDLRMVHFTGYGKEAIKTYKASPDAWVQMIKQLAYYNMFQSPAVTYESCQTRKFLLGRTEVIRSCSQEAKDFVLAMRDASVSDKEREAKLRKAIHRHIQYSAWAVDAQGVDRHMFGLRQLVDKKAGEKTPDILGDEWAGKSSHWILSTSNLSSKYLDGWGYGEVVPDGYGLSYEINDDSIRWCVTTKNNNAHPFGDALCEAAEQIRAMMDRAKGEGQAKL